MSKREKWSALRLAYTDEERRKIMACIQRLNRREGEALNAATIDMGYGRTRLPRPYVRAQLREWFRLRWLYLIKEYEKVLPHTDELP